MLLSRVLSPNRERSSISPISLRGGGGRRVQLWKRLKRVARTSIVLIISVCVIIPCLYYIFSSRLIHHSHNTSGSGALSLDSLDIHPAKGFRDFLNIPSDLWRWRDSRAKWSARFFNNDNVAAAAADDESGESYLDKSGKGMIDDARYRIVFVAKVGLEASYILEWIEFHRYQGVDKFVLYLDDSPYLQNRQTNTLRLLSEYYRQIGLPDLIDLRTSSELIQDQLANILEYDDPIIKSDDEFGERSEIDMGNVSTTSSPDQSTTTGLETTTTTTTPEAVVETNKFIMPSKLPLRGQLVNFHRLGQQTLLKQAWNMYSPLTEWFVHIDIDEFLFSNRHQTLTEYFQDLYRMGDRSSYDDEPDQDIGLLYQVGDLTGIYMHSRNFGLTDSYWFTSTVSLERNPVSGLISLHYTPLHPSFTSLTAEHRFKDMIHNLTDYITGKKEEDKDRAAADGPQPPPPSPLNLFREIYNQQQSEEPDKFNDTEVQDFNSYPFQLERQFFRAPAIQDTDTLDLLKKIVELWPDCSVVQNEILANLASYRKIIDDRTRLKALLKSKNLPDWCAPGHMPAGLTSMGKSILWTGRRYQPPAKFYRADLVQKRKWLHKSTTRNPAYLSTKKPPAYCVVPWVHGCAHMTQSPSLISKSLTLDHHMFRSLESRTIADVAWRSPDGWGRFSNKTTTSFAILEYTNMLYSPDTKNRFLNQVKTEFYKLHKPHQARERLRFGETGLQRIIDTGRCFDLQSCVGAL